MKVVLRQGSCEKLQLQTLVVFTASLDAKKAASISKCDSRVNDLVSRAVADGAFKGGRKEVIFFREAGAMGSQHLLVVGLGDAKKIDAETFRHVGAVALSALKAQKVTSAGILLDSFVRGKEGASWVQALSEGINLGHYEFEEHKFASKEKAKNDPRLKELVLFSGSVSKAWEEAVRLGDILAESQNFARWLGDHSGNTLTPAIFAKHAANALKGTKVRVTAWDKQRIKKERFGGLLGVSLGSAEEPRFIILEYLAAGKGKPTIYLVGKGLTFDSGGISIKPSQGMEEMKYDMCGGAAVVGALKALAQLKAKVNVVGLIPATENMPGPAANKPGDIMIARNGKSVEILNTDAEGRLVLADALSYATEKKAHAIFNFATLTGAIVVALGNTHTGVFTRDQKLLKRIQAASDATGEWIWPMPVTDYHLEDMKGYHADLANISSFKGAGSSTAAAFLEQFVGEGIPFAHFDIAGTAWNVSNRLPYAPKRGASGVMVRTMVELVKSYF